MTSGRWSLYWQVGESFYVGSVEHMMPARWSLWRFTSLRSIISVFGLKVRLQLSRVKWQFKAMPTFNYMSHHSNYTFNKQFLLFSENDEHPEFVETEECCKSTTWHWAWHKQVFTFQFIVLLQCRSICFNILCWCIQRNKYESFQRSLNIVYRLYV